MAEDKKDDPAFLYFPTNYRWSMGLLICLSGAPWTGVEIDEVNRVGQALGTKVGDDTAWFEEWCRIGDKVEARGRDAERVGHRLTAASCYMRAQRYYQTGERFIQPRSERSMEVYAKSVRLFREAAAIIRRPRIEPVEIPYEDKSLPGLLVHPDPDVTRGRRAPAMVFFDGFDVTKELQYGYGVPDLAARGVARAALRVLRRLGRAMGLSRDLGAAARAARFRQSALAVGAARASAMGARGG